MAFDFKKEYKEFYMPKGVPSIVTVPEMNYIAVRGSGNPNDEDGEYKKAIGLLYGIAFTIKMSKKGDRRIEGYYDYVVPPLEGFCRMVLTGSIILTRKVLTGYRLSVFRTLLRKMILTGLCQKPLRRKKRISLKQNSLHIMKAFVYNVCIQVPMMTNRQLSR